jgi:hypothetical protein
MEEYNMMKYEKFVSKDKKNVLTVNGARLELRKPWADCEKQLCGCSKPDAPVFRYQCENGGGCGKFQRLDFGCYRLAIGKAPVKVCIKGCKCLCHGKPEKEEEE